MATEASVITGAGRGRRTAGLVGSYGALVLLAAVVLIPIVLALFQALSPPFNYVAAGKPFHPVDISWVDRTWFDGGALPVVLRTLVLLFALGLVQFRGLQRRGAAQHPAVGALADRGGVVRGAVAALVGTAGFAVVASQAMPKLAHHSASGGLLAGLAMLVVAATAAAGVVGPGRPAWSAALGGVLAGVFIGGGALLVVGPSTWGQGWRLGSLGPAIGRSLTMAVLITVLQVVTSLLAAYAFTFLRFPGRGLLFAVFMATLLLPVEVTLIANVNTIRSLGWIDSNKALVLPFAASAFGTFLIRQGFRGIPSEIRDATRLDGYGHLSFLFKFAVPLTRPVIASFTVISALTAWNQYLWPRSVIDNSTPTAQITLRSIVGTQVNTANVGVAAALTVAVPVVLLLVAFQKQIIRGLTAGAVKG